MFYITVYAFTHITLLIVSVVNTQMRCLNTQFRCHLINKSCPPISSQLTSSSQLAYPAVFITFIVLIALCCALWLCAGFISTIRCWTIKQNVCVFFSCISFIALSKLQALDSLQVLNESELIKAVIFQKTLVSYGQYLCKNFCVFVNS